MNWKMKTRFLATLAALAIIAASTNATSAAIVGWHTPDDIDPVNDSTPDDAVTGVSATLSSSDAFVRDDWNSTDGTYGTEPIPGSPTTANTIAVREGYTVFLDITNNTGGDLVLNTLHFDYSRLFENSPQNVDVFYDSGDLDDSNNTQLLDVNNLAVLGTNTGNYNDFDIDLDSILSDVTLANSESATFRFIFTNANTTNAAGGMDNVAIDVEPAVVIPAPAALPAGLMMLGLVALRRRH